MVLSLLYSLLYVFVFFKFIFAQVFFFAFYYVLSFMAYKVEIDPPQYQNQESDSLHCFFYLWLFVLIWVKLLSTIILSYIHPTPMH